MPSDPRESHRHLASRLLTLVMLAAAVIIAAIALLPVTNPTPAGRTLEYDGARVILTADRQWVTFPGDCVTVTWTVSGAVATTFYPVIEPGIPGGAGTRSQFFTYRYHAGASILEDAPGGIDETLDPEGTPVTRSEPACIDYTTEPKLRVHFTDGTSQALKLGLDVLFLRLETWLMLGSALALVWGAVLLMFPRLTLRPVRLGLWTSALLMLFYVWVFVDHGAFFAVYWLDGLIFTALTGGVLALSALSVWRSARFDTVVHQTADRLRTSPRFTVWLGVLILWGWALGFAYVDRRAPLVSEWLWLPFLLWAALIGFAGLWFTRPPRDSVPRSPRWSSHIALFFALASLMRDVTLYEIFGIMLQPDTFEYLLTGGNLLAEHTSTGLPKRVFPYIAMNFLTRAHSAPLTLVWLQFLIGALAVGALVYVLARRRLWLGILTGALLTFDLSWGTYNRFLLTEGPFMSFHVLSLAAILWHFDRRDRLRTRELIAAGVLFGWSLLFRGTGLPLIAPLLLIYAVMTRSLRQPLFVALGIGAFLAGVLLFNLWRYDEAGLIGPQHDTLVSGLYSYHLFSPDNGPESAALDADLRACMGYLDYDDVPRYENYFIYNHFNFCLVGFDENNRFLPQPRLEVTARVSRAFRELVFSRPFDFARALLFELGKGVKFNTMEAALANLRDTPQIVCVNWFGDDFCNERTVFTGSPQTAQALETVIAALTIPTQVHRSAGLISSESDAVFLAAFVMLCGFVLLAGQQRFPALLVIAFMAYHMLVSAAVHVLIARYTDVLSPFLIVLSAMAMGTLIEQARGFRPRRWMVIAALPVIVYALYANAVLRSTITEPVFAALDVDLLQKYTSASSIEEVR